MRRAPNRSKGRSGVVFSLSPALDCVQSAGHAAFPPRSLVSVDQSAVSLAIEQLAGLVELVAGDRGVAARQRVFEGAQAVPQRATSAAVHEIPLGVLTNTFLGRK
jgi:hypothetical protein